MSAYLGKLGFDYVIRFRCNIHVTDADVLTRPAADWVCKGGCARKLRDARVTAMAATLVNHYAKRWTIEPQFRDTKDLQFGMALSATRIGKPMRRNRLLLISAFATALLTLLGMVGKSLGMDRMLKSNTSTKRTHSLFPTKVHALRTHPQHARTTGFSVCSDEMRG